MVEMVAPQPKDRIGDLAAGTCGFLVNAYEYILEQHTSPNVLYDEKGQKHLVGDRLSPEQSKHLQTEAFTAYDNDSGMTMLRIGSMNLMLHGIQHPRFFYMDTLSKAFNDEKSLDVVLMNPPFKGKMDESDINPLLPTKVKKTELLFLHLILRVLDMGGRCAVIVPDGVLFGSSKAHVEIRKRIIEENRLDGVVSMPSGVFKPYAGVSTAVLLFTRGDTTDRIWFYDMDHDGFSLDDKRQPTPEQNDIPDLLLCWKHRFDTDFTAKRATRLEDLKQQIAPMKTERLLLQKEINRLMFEAAIAPEDDEEKQQALETDQQKLTTLHDQMAPLQWEINQLNRQFWVTKEQVKANKYDLSASRYRQIEQDEVYYESPRVTMERLLKLEHVMAAEVSELEKLLEG
jgi:type I restriction enzyme M protein